MVEKKIRQDHQHFHLETGPRTRERIRSSLNERRCSFSQMIFFSFGLADLAAIASENQFKQVI